ncbi:hypothetical protein ASG76_16290 [Nocardioides sp. Soil774]|uniref:DUF1707 domain-containing protein n=1 Tax=Nocardioides sp. Soil774 TaxID=1736408 RepID=UPI0006F994EE|nr:DUF1707 domain-containing protein [Nocardioides sp. Soil774]KRE92996.1 hypothetical protein ASG76_16290 [Nocardioides sp. Soil774]
MDGMRARDADRDRFVDLIEAAYVDGQLGAEDRELRVTRALSAETVDELRSLTRDLQAPAGAVVPDVAASPARLTLQLVAFVALAVLLLGAGVTSLLALAGGGESDSATSSGVAVDVGSAPAEPELVTSAPFRMEAARVRAFLRAYEAEFGTLDAYEVGFYPARVGVQVPVRGSRPRSELWSFDGGWRQDAEAAAVRPPSPVVDLGALDVRRLFANIAVARKTLGVQGGRLSHVLVDTWTDGQPTVNIHVSNSYGESGYLKTTMSGDVVRAFPYDG